MGKQQHKFFSAFCLNIHFQKEDIFNNDTMKRIKVTAKISVLFISDSWDILDVHEDGTVEKVTDSFFVEVPFNFV